MLLEVVTYPNEILKHVSSDVEEITEELKTFASSMVETMYAEDGIGLAAPQVGRNIRLIVVDVSGPSVRDQLLVIFNPKLTPIKEEGFIEGEEGCLSVDGYRAKVKRHAKVLLEGLSDRGEAIKLEATGLLSVCLQHEVDHLDGVLFIDRISRLKRAFYERKLRKAKNV